MQTARMLTLDPNAVKPRERKGRRRRKNHGRWIVGCAIPLSILEDELFVVTFFDQLVDDAGVDKRGGVGAGGFGSVFFDRF
jgi:hypothetical protein